MHISTKLSELNWQRNQSWKTPFDEDNARPAIYAFAGDVYTGLDAYSIKSDRIPTLQNSLRILSGLYGMLRPLDYIQPYRLEMGTKLAIGNHKNLYEFWGEHLTLALNNEMTEDELLINLASNEYFKVLDKGSLKAPLITPIFKDWKNDALKIISFYAKKARGSMVRYIVDEEVATLDSLKNFNVDGYRYSETHTKNENEPVFIR